MLFRSFGGAEAWPVDALDTIETLCHADAATGWVLMTAQIAMASAAAFLEPDATAQIFGAGLPMVAGQGAPNGRAVATDGGYRLSGKWTYGSGLLHAEYVHTGAFVYDGESQRMLPGSNYPEVRIFILPRSQARLLGNWDVLGLRATGSVDYAIDDLFVPEGYSHRLVETRPRQGGDLYRIGILGFGAIGHTGFALGAARRMLDEIAALAREIGRAHV